jgi:FkbM family methyltransferase
LEPQPDFARLLRALFARSRRVTIVEAAVGRAPGRATLAISARTPTVTTLSEAWREARQSDPEFAGVQWTRALDVSVTTLDALVTTFGKPRFVKVDVEGAELDVLAGLTHPVHTISFEYLPRALELADACAARLESLGPYRFNWSRGESFVLEGAEWRTRAALMDALRAPAARPRPGDVYARLALSSH